MKPLIVKDPPFAGKPPHTNEKPTWIKPELVAEVKFSEWTRDGVMRMPVFLRLRDDVDPRSVRREQALDARKESARAEASLKAPARVASKAVIVERPARASVKPARSPARRSTPGKVFPREEARAAGRLPDTPL